MKNLFFTFIAVFFLTIGFSQSVPQGINYQAIARDASTGQVLTSKAITVKFKLYNSLSAPISYEENHTLTTNEFGYFNTIIGSGSPVSGAFASVTFSTGTVAYEIYIDGNLLGSKTVFQSVPYALYAVSSGGGGGFPTNVSGGGITNVLGTYPNYTVTTPTHSMSFGAGILTINPGGNTVSIPAGTVTNVYAGSGITSVLGSAPSYTISTPTPTLAYASGVLTITPGNTVSIPAGTVTNISAGSNINVIGSAPAYTISAPNPTLITSSGFLTIAPGGNTITIPSPTLAFSPGVSGASHTLTVGSETVSIGSNGVNNGTVGVLPMWTTASTLGGSNINQDAGGRIGIGTPAAASIYSVNIGGPINFNNNFLNMSTVTIAPPISSIGNGRIYLDNSFGFMASMNGSSYQALAGWGFAGNSGTNPLINYIGTQDLKDFVFKTNNVERMRILSSGAIGVGTSTPNALFHAMTSAAVTGNAIKVENSNSSNSSAALRVLTNSTAGGGQIASFESSTSGSASGVNVTYPGAGAALEINNTGSSPSKGVLEIQHSGGSGSYGININMTAVTNSYEGIFLQQQGQGAGLKIRNTNTGTTGNAIDVDTRGTGINSRAIFATNATSGAPTIASFNDGTGLSLQATKETGKIGPVVEFINRESSNTSPVLSSSSNGLNRAAEFIGLNTFNTSDVVFIDNKGQAAGIKVVTGADGGSNKNIGLALDGNAHISSQNGSIGVVCASSGGTISATAIVGANSSDVAGRLRVDGVGFILAKDEVLTITVTFNKQYRTSNIPIVVASCSNINYENLRLMVEDVDISKFKIRVSNKGPGNISLLAGEPFLNYIVIGLHP